MRRIALLLAAVLIVSAAPAAFAKSHRHHGYHARWHGFFFSRGVSLRRQSGAPATVTPSGGDRAPITGGGY